MGYEFVRGDLEFNCATNTKLIVIGFVSALLAAAVGIGPGAVFAPVMIQLDMHTAVASSTAMYLTMFTTVAATINMLIFKRLDVVYMLILCALALLGAIPGIAMQPRIREKAGGRTQFTVIILLTSLILIVVTVFPATIFEAIAAKGLDQSEDVTAFKSYC